MNVNRETCTSNDPWASRMILVHSFHSVLVVAACNRPLLTFTCLRKRIREKDFNTVNAGNRIYLARKLRTSRRSKHAYLIARACRHVTSRFAPAAMAPARNTASSRAQKPPHRGQPSDLSSSYENSEGIDMSKPSTTLSVEHR
jgi:hypothetical protein